MSDHIEHECPTCRSYICSGCAPTPAESNPMTPDKTPTDSEILDAAEDFRSQYKHGGTAFDDFDALAFARAVLAKWGSPVVAVEPVAWRHRMGPTDCWVDCTKEFHDWVLREPEAWKGNEVQALCLATPQPTQAQAGAVPLTPEQAQDLIELESWGPDAIGLNAQLLRTIRRTEAAHGIKGGQHADR